MQDPHLRQLVVRLVQNLVREVLDSSLEDIVEAAMSGKTRFQAQVDSLGTGKPQRTRTPGNLDERILRALGTDRGTSARDLAEVLRVPTKALERPLLRLRGLNLIVKHGERTKTVYTRAGRGPGRPRKMGRGQKAAETRRKNLAAAVGAVQVLN